ncbi:probable aminoacyl tRNA synthase complex-interacting multifunctional protein 2 [Planococcus citri]|uniref:probable aminoacyl tRNA synthase complex-interacting multifunctional protein 2 n=1 Tax=Planococcus citri TaxID=170843 RepID=UPI0031F96373
MSTSTMYKLKTVFDFPAPFRHTSSMYKLKNIQFNRVSNSSDYTSQENHNSENTELHSAEKLVLSRQEKLLAELSKLKDQINAFRVEVDKLNVPMPAASKSNPVSVSKLPEKLDYSALLSDVAAHGIVINADPNYPPYCLLGLNKIWKDLPVSISVHTHSSVETLPKSVETFQLLQKSNSESKSKVNITLVWKDVDEDCEIIISPVKNTLIVGEVNLLRFFYQYLSSDSTLQNVLKHELFDFTRIQYFTGNKKLELMKQLSERLANNEYFSGAKNPDVADLALWSAFMKMQKKDNLPQNISKWLKRSSSYFGV